MEYPRALAEWRHHWRERFDLSAAAPRPAAHGRVDRPGHQGEHAAGGTDRVNDQSTDGAASQITEILSRILAGFLD